MFRNYLLIAWRNLVSTPLFSGINILGLALGLTLAVLIGLYVHHETGYDRWVPAGERIFRVYREWPRESAKSAYVPGLLAGAVLDELPEVQAAARFNGFGEVLVSVDGRSQYLEGAAAGDSLFFRTLPLPLAVGRPESALSRPQSAVISRRAVRQLFDGADPMGKTIRIDNETDYTITGVLDDFPALSHLADVNLLLYRDDYYPSWTGAHCLTYVRLHEGVDPAAAEAKLTALANRHVRQAYLGDGRTPPDGFLPRWRLQALPAVHLHSSDIGGHPGTAGDPRQIAILSLLAGVVLLIAGINYTNLSTARAARRAREVGIRKVSGATRRQTAAQFLTESVVQSLLALGLAVLLAEATLPLFNRLVERQLDTALLFDGALLPGLLALAVLTGLLAGSYPAFFLSAYRPVDILKGAMTKGRGGVSLRRVLVVTQFGLAVVLIVLMGFVWKQVQYMQSQELGFNDEQLVVARINTQAGAERFRGTRSSLLNVPGVRSASLISRMPGSGLTNYNMNVQGLDDIKAIDIFFGDDATARTLGLELASGRLFDDRFPADTARSFVVNERFVRQYKIDKPIGHRLKFVFDEQWGEIIGVVKDFHYAGLQSEIAPLIITTRPGLAWYSSVAIKVDPGQIDRTLRGIGQYWGQVEPAHPFRYSFLDDDFARQYDRYATFGRTILTGALLSIVVALLGLFGLSTFTVEQRTREIGIRKVLGASPANLVGLLVRDFVVLVGVAGVLALPPAFLLVRGWLADFAYRTPLTALPFFLAMLLILLLALLTVGGQAYLSASRNPVEALRTE